MRKLKLQELNRKSIQEYKNTDKIPVVVILDNIRSMYNVGSVFRTCDAFLVRAIYICGITPKPPHREIHKTAIGATESVDWKYFKTTIEALKELKTQGFFIAGLEQTDESIEINKVAPDPQKPLALVLGNEVEGINSGIVSILDAAWEIPQHGTKHSFNVSVAAGIALFHVSGFFHEK